MDVTEKLNWLKENVESTVCFGLFAVLVCVSVHFVNVERGRETAVNQFKEIFRNLSDEHETEPGSIGDTAINQKKQFLAFLMPKPISYYSLIARRNPFVPLPRFEPPKEVGAPIVLPSDLELIRTVLLEGKWVAQIKNHRTGEAYYKTEGEEIARIFSVKKVDKDGVILIMEGKDDIRLTPREGPGPEPPPPPPPPTIELVLVGTIYLPGDGKWVAQIENIRTHKAYFVREGEIIAEIFKVKKIERGMAIVSKEGEEDITLKLGRRGG